MNKRGSSTITWDEIVKAIPAVMIVLLLLWAGVKIWNATHPEKFTTEKKDLKRIVSEIKDLKDGEKIDIPYFSSQSYDVDLVKINDENKIVYNSCRKDYCVCFKKNNDLVTCESFDIDLKNTGCKTKENIEAKSESKIDLKNIRVYIQGCLVKLDYPVPKTPNSQNTQSGQIANQNEPIVPDSYTGVNTQPNS